MQTPNREGGKLIGGRDEKEANYFTRAGIYAIVNHAVAHDRFSIERNNGGISPELFYSLFDQFHEPI